jgi:predicted neutral ceramidase superfamily lipid hydrolase
LTAVHGATNYIYIFKVVENNTKQSGLDCLSFFLNFVSAMPRKVNARHANKKFVNYFTQERDNNGPLLPVGAVQERVA